MLSKSEFLTKFEQNRGPSPCFSDDSLYNLYIGADMVINTVGVPIVKDIREIGIDATCCHIRTYLAERGAEFTPEQVVDILHALLIADEGN